MQNNRGSYVKSGRKHTNYVKSEVAVAANMPGCILGTAVVQAIVVWTGALEGQCPLLIIDLMALLRQLHPVLEPLASRPDRERKRWERGVLGKKTKLRKRWDD